MKILIDAPDNLTVSITTKDGVISLTVNNISDPQADLMDLANDRIRISNMDAEVPVDETPEPRRISLARAEAIEKGVSFAPHFSKPGKPRKEPLPALSEDIRKAVVVRLAAGEGQAEIADSLGIDGRRLNGIRRWDLPEYVKKQAKAELVYSEESEGYQVR